MEESHWDKSAFAMRLSMRASLRNDHVNVNMSVLHAGQSFSRQEAQRLSGQLDNSSQSYLNKLKNNKTERNNKNIIITNNNN